MESTGPTLHQKVSDTIHQRIIYTGFPLSSPLKTSWPGDNKNHSQHQWSLATNDDDRQVSTVPL